MTRLEFLMRLRESLGKLPPDEIENAVRYYVEYLDEAGPEQEEQVLQEWGDPAVIAQQIVAEYMVRDIVPAAGNGKKKSDKKGIYAVWIAVLAVFASPIALPLAIAAAAVIFAMVVAILAVFFSLLAAVALVGVAGLIWTAVGFFSLVYHAPTGLFIVGTGMAAAGAGLLLFWLLFLLSRTVFSGMARLIRRGILRRRGKTGIARGNTP